MVRTLLPFLIIVLPTLLYVGYARWRQWVAAMVAALLVTWTMIGGVPGGGSYQPPQMTPEGRIEPGDFAIPE